MLNFHWLIPALPSINYKVYVEGTRLQEERFTDLSLWLNKKITLSIIFKLNRLLSMTLILMSGCIYSHPDPVDPKFDVGSLTDIKIEYSRHTSILSNHKLL